RNGERGGGGGVGRAGAGRPRGCPARREDRGDLVRVALPGAHLVVADGGRRDPIFQWLQEQASPGWRLANRASDGGGEHVADPGTLGHGNLRKRDGTGRE